jgi:dipeptidyl aminopeptidase/acylaminoacyl peptidase
VYDALAGPKELVVVPSESHAFAEPAAIAQVAREARHWFLRYLA